MSVSPLRLLPSRHAVPTLPHPLVPRRRLEDLLDDRRRRHITLVSGLPGAGKTTLVASWLRTADRRAAWVALDARDNEPGRLARSVVSALAGASAVEETRGRRRRVPTTALDEAFASLAAGSWVLVLDDVHELRSPEALKVLRHMLDRSPATLPVVLCARADPPVALGRLRLAGRLGEIRNADLEFTVDEAEKLFAACGIELRHDEVHALWRRTQGWIAGLRLAAGALGGGDDDRHEVVRSTTATEAAVAEYLLEEVLDRQDPATQEFLLRTSVVERLTPSLAAELSADPEAAARLDQLARSGVFITDVSDGGWYRYHALFADLLRAGLRRRSPDLLLELHRRAAAWMLSHGARTEAESHARLAGDWDMVGRLVSDRWLVATLDDAQPAPDPLTGTPPAAIRDVPDLALVAAAMACARGARDDADLHRSRADELLGPRREASAEARGARRRIVDACYGWAFGANPRAREATRVMASAGETCPDAAGHASAIRRLARLRRAELHLDDGHLDAAVATLTSLADVGDDEWTTLEASAVLALIHAASGNLEGADRRAAPVLASDVAEVHPTALRAVHLARALCCAQRGERRSAHAHLDAADAAGPVAARPLAAVQRALHATVRGATPGSAWLDSATAGHPLVAQVLVAGGALEIVDPQRRLVAVGGPAERAVVRARQDLDRGAPEAARRGLEHTLTVSLASVHTRTVIEARTLAAVAAAAGGRDADARTQLRLALDLVAATGIRAPLSERARSLVGLLEQEMADPARRRLVLELLDQLRRSPSASPVETLTDRETAVLQYLPTLMSNAEIADGLHLSINTVKSHLKAVYRKLGVDGRRDAVLRGRELELI
ncbi:MAG TPA: LuxR C-terminal-related transcriptional regulator [Acidimicrobiales bacterium]|nr:LuxR C-terminal-related transcriptional regulator [Acidimicrobiales bacterium]